MRRKTLQLLALSAILVAQAPKAQPDLRPYDVVWESQSADSWGSMPIGNGDIGANLWVDQSGTLHFYISKTDAHSEIGRLLKIGKLEVRFTPNILDAQRFSQRLSLKDGMLAVEAEKDGRKLRLNCRVDANRPVILIEGKSDFPFTVEVANKIWRNRPRLLTGPERHSGYGVAFRDRPFMTEVDTVLRSAGSIAWCHENRSSVWQMTLDNQNISDFNRIGKDPDRGQRFGAVAGGPNLLPKDDRTLVTGRPSRNLSLAVAVRKAADPDLQAWQSSSERILQDAISTSSSAMLKAHVAWWRGFWDRHHIIVRSSDTSSVAYKVTQAYVLQRYMNACAGRGGRPIKFNGSIFTVDLQQDLGSGKKGFDADYREWGGNYWFQNTRLIYWTMFHAGDTDLMRPFFDMYLDALPLARFRTKRYFGHDGAYFPETHTPFGAYLVDNYGWDRKGKPDGVSDNLYIRYYWQCGLELVTMMLEYVSYTGDTSAFRSRMAPFISDILTFYDLHYPRDADGRLLITPAQSLETFQEGVVNPTPELAGLMYNLDRIAASADLFRDDDFLRRCRRLREALPPLPISDSAGRRVLLAGFRLGVRANIENPELYAVFPYPLLALGGIDSALGRQTFAARHYRMSQGWHQDAIQAALVGETEEARRMVIHNATHRHTGSRFPAFWGPNYDWVPDQDHGTVMMRALQNMLVQADGERTLLFPAWPADWDVDFKLHLPGRKTVEGSYSSAKGVRIRKKPSGTGMRILLR